MDIIEKNKRLKEEIKNNIFYIVIFLLSFIVLFIFPFFGSTVNLKMAIPNTVAGWILYVVEKLLISSLNLMIFYSFNEQGRINVKDNPNYKKACEITAKYKPKEYAPRSPKEYNKHIWSTKGITIFIGTIVSLVGIGQAVLKYDYIMLIAYIVVILISICFGIISMMKTEDYYVNEFYDYALNLERRELNV